jgi:HlyD family secretion protein
MRRVLTILVVLAVVVGGSLLIYRYTSQAKEPPPPDYEIVKANKGDMISTVSATGTIQPEGEVALVFKGAGRVGEVLVQEGDAVIAGQVLARLESNELDLAQAQAEAALSISQAQLSKLKKPVAEADLAAARAAVASAQAAVDSAREAVASAEASYGDLVAGPSTDQKTAAAATLERARVVRDQAQAAYDQIASQPDAGLMPQSLQLQQATIDYETALANYNVTVAPPKPGQVAAAKTQIAQAKATQAQATASLAQAQASLDKLLEGVAEQDLAVAEAQIVQSQLQVQQARLNKENAVLTTPIDGTVTKLAAKVGEIVSAAVAAAVVTDLSRFHIDIDVDEIDIGKLSEGQNVRVTLDALDDAELSGHIEHISPTPTNTGGVTAYSVTVVIDEANTPLRSGLSATASIVTEELKDILLVPNRSIQIDRGTGRAYVEKLVNAVPTRTEITLGARNEQSSQVLSGLEQGDELAIRSGTGLERLRSTMFGQ